MILPNTNKLCYRSSEIRGSQHISSGCTPSVVVFDDDFMFGNFVVHLRLNLVVVCTIRTHAIWRVFIFSVMECHHHPFATSSQNPHIWKTTNTLWSNIKLYWMAFFSSSFCSLCDSLLHGWDTLSVVSALYSQYM